jgi:glycosyltransferase involved in cell wall biosynthesis
MRIWIDVEDLFQYAAHVSRPSGIQRLAFELQRALVALAPEEVRFVRHDRSDIGFVAVSFSTVMELFTSLTVRQSDEAAEPLPSEAGAENPHDLAGRPVRRFIRDTVSRLPPRQSAQIRRFRYHAREAFRALLGFFRTIPRLAFPVGVVTGAPGTPSVGADTAPSLRHSPVETFGSKVAAGDWLVVLGSPWFAENYAELITTTRKKYGIRFALLVYDIIPIRRPEWVDQHLQKSFTGWFDSMLPLANCLFAISHATTEDVKRYAVEAGLPLQGPVQTIPIGTGFGEAPVPLRTARLPPPKSFVLIVSTIEARKNHVLLFRVWRHLLETMAAEQVPTLVFAGRVGWLVDDLIQQLKNAQWLGGKIRLIEGPSDGELATLYQDCLFTVFPSHYEGWGLPVTESLAHGAPCLAADRTSLPEAGGQLARYFDPDNLHDAVRAVRGAIEDRGGLEAWRMEISREFTPVSWNETAAATLGILRNPAMASIPDAGSPAAETVDAVES